MIFYNIPQSTFLLMQVVDLIKRVSGASLRITVERGELVVPNMADCFPVTGDRDLEVSIDQSIDQSEAFIVTIDQPQAFIVTID